MCHVIRAPLCSITSLPTIWRPFSPPLTPILTRKAYPPVCSVNFMTIGQAPLQWAFAEAAVLFWRDPPAAQPDLARVENKHGQGTALPLLAQQLARAVYDLRKRTVACARETVLQCYGRGAAEPEASLANKGAHLQEARDTAKSTASVQAQAPRGHDTLRPVPLIGPPLALLLDTVRVANGRRVLLLTRA